jgi:hypothetical protein
MPEARKIPNDVVRQQGEDSFVVTLAEAVEVLLDDVLAAPRGHSSRS